MKKCIEWREVNFEEKKKHSISNSKGATKWDN